jgi:hypothetical protein
MAAILLSASCSILLDEDARALCVTRRQPDINRHRRIVGIVDREEDDPYLRPVSYTIDLTSQTDYVLELAKSTERLCARVLCAALHIVLPNRTFIECEIYASVLRIYGAGDISINGLWIDRLEDSHRYLERSDAARLLGEVLARAAESPA